MRLVIFIFSVLLLTNSFSQKFKPDVFGHVSDPAFKTLIKERGYELVGAFLKEKFNGKEILISQVWTSGRAAYIDTDGNEYADGAAVKAFIIRKYPQSAESETERRQNAMARREIEREMFIGELNRLSGSGKSQPQQPGIFRDGMLFGFMKENQVILPAQYDTVSVVKNSEGELLLLECNGQFGIASTEGKIIVPVAFDNVELLAGNADFIFVSNGEQLKDDFACGLYDLEGNKLTSIAYTEIRKFSDSLLAFRREEGYDSYMGIFNPYEKNWLIRSNYKMEFYGDEEFIGVHTGKTEDRLYGVIDKKGNWVLEPAYTNLRIREKEKQFLIEKDGKWSVITADKKTIIPFKYDYISALNNCPKCSSLPADQFIVAKEGKFGIVNAKDEVLVPLTLEEFGATNSALMIEGNESSVFMDINCNVIFIADFHVTRVSRGIIEGRSNGYSGAITADLYGNVINR